MLTDIRALATLQRRWSLLNRSKQTSFRVWAPRRQRLTAAAQELLGLGSLNGRSTGALSAEYLMWTLIIGNAAALVALLLTLSRLHRLQSFVTMCACSKTIKYEQEWISFEQYLGRRFNVQVRHGLSRGEASKLKAHLDSLAVDEEATGRTLGHHGVACLGSDDRGPAPPRSALDDFPEENSLRNADRPGSPQHAKT